MSRGTPRVIVVVAVVVIAALDATGTSLMTRERFAKSRTEIEIETTDRTRTARMSRRLFIPRPRPADDFDDAIDNRSPPSRSSRFGKNENGRGIKIGGEQKDKK